MKRPTPSWKKDSKEIVARVRSYLESQTPPARRWLTKVRALIRAAAPGAVEVFSYGIPGFRLEGQPLVWYAGWRSHASLYPMTAGIRRAYAAEIEGYKMSTGTIQFPLDKPVPVALVKKLVKARVAEVRAKRRGVMVPESQLWTLAEPDRSRIARGLDWAAGTEPSESDLTALAKRKRKPRGRKK